MATKRPRYMISVSDELFNAIEDFRFENRFQTRSEATAELIRLGLESLEKNHAGAYAAFGGDKGENTLSQEEIASGVAALRHKNRDS